LTIIRQKSPLSSNPKSLSGFFIWRIVSEETENQRVLRGCHISPRI
jgi:hypothetical protein